MNQQHGRTYRPALSNDSAVFVSLASFVACVALSGCGAGSGNSGGGTQSQAPTITSVSITCSSATVPTGMTSQCSATVTGTGNYSNAVVWAVNGTSGGNQTYGSIGTTGLYQAPMNAPASYIVTLSATSSADSTKSGSFAVLIAGIIASTSQPIVASVGGTISLPGGSSVTIPAGTLTANTTATLQLSSVATQPVNTLFSGLGPSLLMSLSPAVGGVGALAREPRFVSNATSNVTVAVNAPNITFVLQGGQNVTTAQLQNALGVLDVQDGTDNFFALTSSYSAASNSTTLQVASSTVEGGSTLQIGLTLPLSSSLLQAGSASLRQWDEDLLDFKTPVANLGSNFCPTGARTLVVIHGMFSTVEGTYIYSDTQSASNNTSNSWAVDANSTYSTVLGVDYDWKGDINSAAKSIAAILNSLFDSDPKVSPCNYQGTFDIEAHSEGTVVTLASSQTGNLSSSTESKLKHIVLVAGPVDGTPVASQPLDIITYYLNLTPPSFADLIPVAITAYFPFISELQPNSPTIQAAQAAAETNLPDTEIIAVGGDKPYLDWWDTWLTEAVLSGVPNDGVIPVSSALPTDSSLPNLVRLIGNDPVSGDYTYPNNHTHLVNDPNVMNDVLLALNNSGETAQVTLNISPQTPLLLVNQSVPLTANTANILNPQIRWSLAGGANPGTLNQATGASVQYSAPQTPGAFPITATLPAILRGSPSNALSSSTTISVDNPIPTITQPLVPASLPVGSASQMLTINGSGFVPTSTVTFNGVGHPATFVNANQLTITLTSGDLATTGSYSVVVTNPASAGGNASATFTVVPYVTISPSSVSIPASSIQTFTAQIYGGGSVTWSVKEGSPGGSITSAGLYTAPTQIGTYHVIATNAANSTQTVIATVNVVSGLTITTLHSFNHAMEGAIPWGPPVWGIDGNMYGVTEAGGTLACGFISTFSGCGTIYKSDLSGNLTTLHSFTGSDGAYPIAPLLLASNGTFYGASVFGGANISECVVGGTTIAAGCGSLFEFSTSTGFASIYSFGPFNSPLGISPEASLVQASNGTIYGANAGGGSANCSETGGTVSGIGCGSIFDFTAGNLPNVVHTFSGTEGATPTTALLRNSDGNFYGTTSGGGILTCSSYDSAGCGTVFQMTSAGAITSLHSFTALDGAYPASPLILGADGNMYGSTIFGGDSTCTGGARWQGCGTVFKIDTTGSFTTLHSFSGLDGAYPTALMQSSDGFFYGTTQGGGDVSCVGRYGSGCGTVFRMDLAGNVTILYSFTGQSDGSWPESGVILGTDGNLYGTTAYGGVHDDGVIFRISSLAAIKQGAMVVKVLESIQPTPTPLLEDHPHVGLPAPATAARP